LVAAATRVELRSNGAEAGLWLMLILYEIELTVGLVLIRAGGADRPFETEPYAR